MSDPVASSRPRSLLLTLIFINLNAILWLALGLTSLSPSSASSPQETLIRRAMPIAAFALSIGLFAVMISLIRGWRPAWYAAFILLALTSILILTSGIGWVSLLLAALGLFPICLLIKDRSRYLKSQG